MNDEQRTWWIQVAIASVVMVVIVVALMGPLKDSLNYPCSGNLTADINCPPPQPYRPIWLQPAFLGLLFGTGLILAVVGAYIKWKYGRLT